MGEDTRASSPIYSLLPSEIAGFNSLAELALDLRWSWNHGTDFVWKQLDPALWESTQNPWAVLQTVSREELQPLLADPASRKEMNALLKAERHLAESPAWFQQAHPRASLTCVAYFSMEFMLSEALPIYSGGLGNVAGDQLKAASDLGVPLIGVGLLYQRGYFHQVIDKDGRNRRSIHTTIQGNCRSRRCASPMASGCGWRSRCPVTRSGSVPGRRRSAEPNSTCWTATTPPTSPSIAASRASCMVASRSCAYSRNWFWGSAAGGCSRRSASTRRSVTSMKGMRPSPFSSGRGASWRRLGNHSRSPSPSPGRAISSRPTRRWRPDLTVLRLP